LIALLGAGPGCGTAPVAGGWGGCSGEGMGGGGGGRGASGGVGRGVGLAGGPVGLRGGRTASTGPEMCWHGVGSPMCWHGVGRYYGGGDYRVGGGSRGFLGQNDMLQDTVFINNLLDHVTWWNLHGEGDGGFVVDADHTDCGWTLNHLYLFPQLETDGLPLMDVEVDDVLACVGRHAVPCGAWIAHGHCDPGALTGLATAAGRGYDDRVGVAVVLVPTSHA